MTRVPIALHMETSDPDDAMALCVLATHPRARLACVTVHPGDRQQVGLVRSILGRLGCEVPVGGAGRELPAKPRVSLFHEYWLGSFAEAEADGEAPEILARAVREVPGLHLVTGAALTYPAAALRRDPDLRLHSWTCQGGFVGSNLMPADLQLPKFAGLLTCPSFNVNGDPRAALELFGSPQVAAKDLVTKAVCHGLIFGPAQLLQVAAGAHAGLDLLREGMAAYVQKHPAGKALHDVVAAALALSPELGTWVPAVPYRERGQWGCRAPGAGDPAPCRALVRVGEEALLRAWAA